MIYLDHNATSPTRPEVTAAMLPYYETRWGNPGSTYAFGASLKKDIEGAREAIALLIGANSDEIVFTGSATESSNMAISSALAKYPSKRHIIVSGVEHAAVLNTVANYERAGYRVSRLPVLEDGSLSLQMVQATIQADTALVAVMFANNETGVVFPIDEISSICANMGVPLYCDAVQAAGRLPINLRRSKIDYLSVSAHKIGGPKGVAALYCTRKSHVVPLIYGGMQEFGRRAGTENVAGIVGFGQAAQLALREMADYRAHVSELRDAFEAEALRRISNCYRNGNVTQRIPNTTNLSFVGIESEALLMLLDRAGICASTGSACLADSPEPSHVISAMRNRRDIPRDYLRFSFGLANTRQEVDQAISVLVESISVLRELTLD